MAKDYSNIIQIFTQYMRQNYLADLNEPERHQRWIDISLLINKNANHNEARKLHYLYNKIDSPIREAIKSEFKKGFLEELK